jgi:AAA+ superfamily predicted ATPase
VSSESLLASLRAAVDAAPDDLTLRLHLAHLLIQAGQRDEGIRQAAGVLEREPTNGDALRLLTQAEHDRAAAIPDEVTEREREEDVLRGLDEQLRDLVPPMFVQSGPDDDPPTGPGAESRLALKDVAGMDEVKAKIEAAVLAPLRRPDLGRLYAKSLRGGLLLYGPPGCGKTFIARALAGEMGANFLVVSLADVLGIYIGESERNVREIFDHARRNAPCVIFFEEIDALGHKRSQMRNNAARGTVNQLLSEMDGIASDNTGVYVIGTTNHPWDVDVALRRPGRFDRMLLVLPPDEAAREAILRHHLQDRPVRNIDTHRLARRTDGYSGADLAYLCEIAAEQALVESARSEEVRMITTGDLERALDEVKPSIGPWLETARNVAQFANDAGTYDDLLAYLRKRRLA